jgi:hypothetical protein
MTNSTLGKIEERIRYNSAISDKNKDELLDLLASLQNEIHGLSKSHVEESESIVGFTERSIHEAYRTKRDQTLFKLSINALSASVKEFETSHPKLVGIVNNISSALSRMGI